MTFSLIPSNNKSSRKATTASTKKGFLSTQESSSTCSLLKKSSSTTSLEGICSKRKANPLSPCRTEPKNMALKSTPSASNPKRSSTESSRLASSKRVVTSPAGYQVRGGVFENSHKNKYLVAANAAASTLLLDPDVHHIHDNSATSLPELNPSLSTVDPTKGTPIANENSHRSLPIETGTVMPNSLTTDNQLPRQRRHHQTHSISTSTFFLGQISQHFHLPTSRSHNSQTHSPHSSQSSTLNSVKRSDSQSKSHRPKLDIVPCASTLSSSTSQHSPSSPISTTSSASILSDSSSASQQSTIVNEDTPTTSTHSLNISESSNGLTKKASWESALTTSSTSTATTVASRSSRTRTRGSLSRSPSETTSRTKRHERLDRAAKVDVPEFDQVFSHPWCWRLIFIIGILFRLYFSRSSSYIHPDEHFQGPESIADFFFGWATKKSWEFSSAAPARSYFVVWIVYGIPMFFVDLIHRGSYGTPPDPKSVLMGLRLAFALGNWVLSDMAIDRLTQSDTHKLVALFFTATSYVTWTYQSHTFSNSVETVILLWCLVIIYEVETQKQTRITCFFSRLWDSILLGSLVAFGVFNRITFPAFLVVPALRLIPFFWEYPFSLFACAFSFVTTSVIAVYFDTVYYGVFRQYLSNNAYEATPSFPFSAVASVAAETFQNPPCLSTVNPFSLSSWLSSDFVITPLNNLLYNLNSENLALHGVHSRAQHILVNLPQLLGPAVILLISTKFIRTIPFQSALSGILIMSLVQHQESRFLVPAVPLLCCCLDFNVLRKISIWAVQFRNWSSRKFNEKFQPTSELASNDEQLVVSRKLKSLKRTKSIFFSLWSLFNILLGILMGILHQGGVLPAQIYISKLTDHHIPSSPSFASAFSTSPANPLVTSGSIDLNNTSSLNQHGPVTDYVFIWWKTYSPLIWMLGKPIGSVSVIDPIETVAGEGGTWERYVPVFEFLEELENITHSLTSESDPTITFSGSKEYTQGPNNSNPTALSSTWLNHSHNGPSISVIDMMGANPELLASVLRRLSLLEKAQGHESSQRVQKTYLVSPVSAILTNKDKTYVYSHTRDGDVSTKPSDTRVFKNGIDGNVIDDEKIGSTHHEDTLFSNDDYKLHEVWKTRLHVSLDDIDVTDLRSLALGLGVYEVVN